MKISNEDFWAMCDATLKAEIIAGKHDAQFPNLRKLNVELMGERGEHTTRMEALAGCRVVHNPITDELQEDF